MELVRASSARASRRARALIVLALVACAVAALPFVIGCDTTGPSTLSNGQTLPPGQSATPLEDAGPDGG